MLARMRSTRLILGLLPLSPVLLVAASCQAPEASQIGLVMRMPQGALDTAKAVDLFSGQRLTKCAHDWHCCRDSALAVKATIA